MWMPDETKSIAKTAGGLALTGTIASRVDHQQPRPAGFFSGQEPDVWLFRLQEDQSGRLVPCRFEGMLSGMLDQGDHVTVQGFLGGGVLHVRKIVDDQGSVLAASRCFVATAVFGDLMAPEVETLRRFREQVLVHSAAGRLFIAWYWRVGPRAARYIETHPCVRRCVRTCLLHPLCLVLNRCLWREDRWWCRCNSERRPEHADRKREH